MRPALLRLLKRPSAVSVLDSLISTPTGIEQLDTSYKHLRCHTRCIWQKQARKEVKLERGTPIGNNEHPTTQHRAPTKRPFSFRVHEIGSPTNEHGSAAEPWQYSRTDSSPSTLSRSLGLQPEKLEFESDIGHTRDIGTRLVDDPLHRHDLALWEELLRYRQRHYGEKGTLDIWEGLTIRLDGIQLPIDGERADFFWESFINLGLRREVLMKELETYALDLWRNTGKRWNRFHYKVVAGYLERGMVQQAVTWHLRLQDPHLEHPNDILQLLEPAISRFRREVNHPAYFANSLRSTHLVLRAFMKICTLTDGHRIYGPAISRLLQEGLAKEAWSMHRLLIARDDHPQKAEDLEGLTKYAIELAPPQVVHVLQRYASNRFANKREAADDHNPDPREGTAPKEDDTPWINEKPFKDDFGARLFATQGFNFDMILGGLQMFGATAIGPESLREMAVRAHGSQDLLEKIRSLEASGISIGTNVFARLVRKLAAEKREILLSDLLHGDQHPDVLEDPYMQESLLVACYMARDWRQYQLVLAILGELSHGDPELLNVHFRKYIAVGDLVAAVKMIDAMDLRGVPFTQHSFNFLLENSLGRRRTGSGPPTEFGVDPSKQAMLVFRILQRTVKLGCPVAFDIWEELLKRLGMLNHFEELRECCLWLARYYSPKAKTSNQTLLAMPSGKHTSVQDVGYGAQMLKMIFSHQMQTSIIAWGFFMGNVSIQEAGCIHVDGERLIPWVRGLLLLRELERNGVQLSLYWIRRACRHRLAILFGKSRLSSRSRNRKLRHENPYDIHRVINDMKRAWGDSTLFRERHEKDLKKLVNPPSTAMSLRRTASTMWLARNHLPRDVFEHG